MCTSRLDTFTHSLSLSSKYYNNNKVTEITQMDIWEWCSNENVTQMKTYISASLSRFQLMRCILGCINTTKGGTCMMSTSQYLSLYMLKPQAVKEMHDKSTSFFALERMKPKCHRNGLLMTISLLSSDSEVEPQYQDPAHSLADSYSILSEFFSFSVKTMSLLTLRKKTYTRSLSAHCWGAPALATVTVVLAEKGASPLWQLEQISLQKEHISHCVVAKCRATSVARARHSCTLQIWVHCLTGPHTRRVHSHWD